MEYNMVGFDVLSNNNGLPLVKEYLYRKAKGDVPYEWFFLISFYRLELEEKLFLKDKNDLAYKFLIFALQSNYRFQPWNCEDYYNFIKTESRFQEFVYKKIYEHNLDGHTQIKQAEKFSTLVMHFLIRYMGYSLVLTDDKIIYTTLESSDEKLVDYVTEGYSIYRLCPIKYVELPTNDNNKLKGVFKKVPITSSNEMTEEFDKNFVFEPLNQVSRK